MNARAKKHVAKAKDYLAKGDQLYRKAKPEIDKARAEGASVQEISAALGKSEDWVQQVIYWDGKGTLYGNDSSRRTTAAAKQVLREASPEAIAKMVADLDVDKRVEVGRALERETLSRQQDREKVADGKFREAVGDETADDLELAQDMKDSEWWLVKAHQDVQSFLKSANRIGVENTPEAWRQACLNWIESVGDDLGMARALVQGEDVDWTAFDDMLKEVS